MSPALNFDLIAFDWDGTLFDSTAIIVRCIQEAVRDVGGTVPSDREAAYVIGLGLMQALAHAAPDVPRERYALLGERYRHHYMAQQGRLSLFEGVLPMLQALSERGHVHSVELQGRFQGSRTADETAGKPHPRMLEELMAEFGVAPERTLMVGDTTHDLQMALNAGCASVAVSYGAHEPQGLHALGPRAVVHTVDELQRWLLLHG
jgi:phosphoglycolate phosphatase